MSTSYVPTKDADLDAWMNNFQTLVAAAPATYGLTSTDATALTGEYNTFHAAYLLVTNPSTKTKTTVNAKDVARNAAIVVYRAYSTIIRANLAVTDANKIALGIPPRDPTNTPVPPPATFPVITVLNNTALVTNIQIRDTLTPTSRAKPAGVKQMELHAVTSATVISDPASIPYRAILTRTPDAIAWDASDAGKTAYIAARWMNGKGQVGPWRRHLYHHRRRISKTIVLPESQENRPSQIDSGASPGSRSTKHPPHLWRIENVFNTCTTPETLQPQEGHKKFFPRCCIPGRDGLPGRRKDAAHLLIARRPQRRSNANHRQRPRVQLGLRGECHRHRLRIRGEPGSNQPLDNPRHGHRHQIIDGRCTRCRVGHLLVARESRC